MSASFFAPYQPGSSSAALPPGVVLRPADLDDTGALAGIEAAVRGGNMDLWRTAMEQALLRPRSAVFVACADAVPVAYAKASWLAKVDDGVSPEGFYLAGCTVLPAHRRMSLGRALTAHRLEWIAAQSDGRPGGPGTAVDAWYFVNAANQASLALHAEFGFVEVARGPRFHGVEFTGGEGVLLRSSFVV
ncbi:GNAT family N-acetyltransferase [Arthrobacter sp. 35W]|uniref:GNAT family N-acetyltransferase n=1 Tax=Arthrobacter sp. 35W TaxID=1132441 RepID=UPI00042575F8|nr:GNAT family N-acetyltransferase [Arthrobacter sp. 35W]